MDPAYGDVYRTLYERHWWWRAREAVVCDTLDRRRPRAGWRRVLDVGCGDGLLFRRLRAYAAQVEGVEPDAGLVAGTQRDGGFIHIRPFDPSFRPAHRYDLILFLDVLEHMTDPRSAVAHAASLMDEGGVVLVTVPAYRHLWTSHDDLNQHVTRYTGAELVRLLSDDFVVEQARHFFRWVHAAKLVQRGLEKLRRPVPTPPRIPPSPLNTLMYGLSRTEEAVLGWSGLPVGSSLLAVARKR